MHKNNIKKLVIFLIVFTMFFINKNVVQAVTISLPDYCTKPSSYGDIKNGHLCANSDSVFQCNASNVSSEQEGLPTKCTSDIVIQKSTTETTKCEGYYYSFSEPSKDLFVDDSNSWIYRQMLCNGLTNKGEKLNYLYLRGDKIRSVEYDYPIFYNKVKSDLEKGVADSEMGDKEAEKDRENIENNENSVINKIDDNTNLDLGNGTFTIDCSSFSALHTVYVMILILAPIAVIVLGSIDFAKAVMTSDEEKMKKFKSKFPKRVIALVLLFVTPFIINAILEVFTNSTARTMLCITKGYSDPITIQASSEKSTTETNKVSNALKSACSKQCSSTMSPTVEIQCTNNCVNNYKNSCENIKQESEKKKCYKTYAKKYKSSSNSN